jgi:DNA-binding NarL/FixJ family response regulator
MAVLVSWLVIKVRQIRDLGMLINVVIVDAHNIIRQGLAKLLENAAEIAIVGSASTSETAISLVREKRPHVVLMDLRMPGIGSLASCRQILE